MVAKIKKKENDRSYLLATIRSCLKGQIYTPSNLSLENTWSCMLSNTSWKVTAPCHDEIRFEVLIQDYEAYNRSFNPWLGWQCNRIVKLIRLVSMSKAVQILMINMGVQVLAKIVPILKEQAYTSFKHKNKIKVEESQ